MGKRKRDRDEDYLLKRIKKLEDRLRRHDETETLISDHSESAWDHEEGPIVDTAAVTDSASAAAEESSPKVTVDTNTSTNTVPTDTAAVAIDDTPDEVTLDEDFLTLLGDAPKDESPMGPDVQKDIAARLREVIKNGLKKEHKDKIIEENPFPANCQIFKAPVLNPEIKAAVSDLLQKKDVSIETRQNQIGIALTALSRALNILVQEKTETNQILVKHISNASRLLCDSHYIDTKLRRNFLVSTLNNKMKETLKTTNRDKLLFGEDLAEKLKASKAISKSSQDLKSVITKPKPGITRNQPASSQNYLNSKSPHPGVQTRKPVPSSHRATGWSQTVKSQAVRRPQPQPQPLSARGTVRYKHNTRRTQ